MSEAGIELRNSRLELYQFRMRLAILVGLVLFMFFLLFARFVWLQVIERSHYSTLADANRISVVPIVPNRGLIVDRNGVILAHNYSAYTLDIDTSVVNTTKNLDALIKQLSQIVEITPRDIRNFQQVHQESKALDLVPIRTHLSDEEVARFAVQSYRFPNVSINAQPFRQYPQGNMYSHVIGHIGRITDDELDNLENDGLDPTNYRSADYIGKTGLERYYEKYLRGNVGIDQIEVDANGHAVRQLSSTSPISGSKLVLNLDSTLQQIAYQAFGDRRGALVALDPNTGGVLALVSKPGFDVNLFVDGIDPQSWKALNESPDKPMINRAIAGAYPPGSTFKPYMALAALTYGKRRPEQKIFDPGYFAFGNHIFHDDKPSGHGLVDMYTSLVQSCDTYYYMLANDLGIENIDNFMRQFGFGQPTGIDIPGEWRGVLPSPEWKQARFHQKWYPGETISIGIGQGYNSYTPIQIAQAIATLANDGVMYRPHVVNYIEDPRTLARTRIEPQPLRTISLNPQYFEIVKNALIGVNKEGTAAGAFANAGYVSAGKTGTAQVVGLKGEKYDAKTVSELHRDHALYVGYAPADHPRIAVAVVVENAGFGAVSAAPIARQIFDYYLLGITPKAPAKDNSNGSVD